MHSLPDFDPPLLNSSSYWASTEQQLSELYNCKSTGAITVRTSLLDGFRDDPAIHQYGFFQAPGSTSNSGSPKVISSLNTIGYSPITLWEYIGIIDRISKSSSISPPKPVIFSVTGTASEVAQAVNLLSVSPCKDFAALEVNLSCPNIPGKPPPAYSQIALVEYLDALPEETKIPVGLKLAPFTYRDQFDGIIDVLRSSPINHVSFLTSSNTLGTSLVLNDELNPMLNSASGMGIGGLAGAALHPLALGNVKTLRTLLDQDGLDKIKIIGVGGVSDRAGYERMRKVGASAVGLATALGAEGVGVFAKILGK